PDAVRFQRHRRPAGAQPEQQVRRPAQAVDAHRRARPRDRERLTSVVQRRGLVLGVLASVAVAGCGGGSSASKSNASSSAPKVTTKAEFIAKANALCTKGKKVEPSEAQIIDLLSSVPLQ